MAGIDDLIRNAAQAGGAPEGNAPAGIDALIRQASGSPAQQSAGLDEPNNLERVLGTAINAVPFLPTVLDYVARPFFSIANVADAGVMAIQGRGGEALERLGDAGRNLASMLPFVDNPTFEQRRTFKDVLTSAGVGDLGVADLPLIGKVSGKGALGLGLDLVAAGKLTPRIGGRLNVAPRSPVLREVFPKGGLKLGKRGFERSLEGVPSTLAAEAEVGSRALVSMFNRPIIKDINLPFVKGSFLEMVDLTRRGLAKTLFSPLTKARGLSPEFARLQEWGRGRGIGKMIQADEAAVKMADDLVAYAKERGVLPEDVFDRFLLGAERGGSAKAQRVRRRALAEEIADTEAQIAELVPGQKREMLTEKLARLNREFDDFEGSLRKLPGNPNLGTSPSPRPTLPPFAEFANANPYRVPRSSALRSQYEIAYGRLREQLKSARRAADIVPELRQFPSLGGVWVIDAPGQLLKSGGEGVRGLGTVMSDVKGLPIIDNVVIVDSASSGSLATTVVHEAAHQLARKMGIKERLRGMKPRTSLHAGRFGRGAGPMAGEEAFVMSVTERVLGTPKGVTEDVLTRNARIAGPEITSLVDEALQYAGDTARDTSMARAKALRIFREYKDKDGPYKLTNAQARDATLMHMLNHVDKDMAPIAAGFLGLFRNNIRNEIQAGIAISQVADPFLNYITRTLKPEAMEAIQRAGLLDDLGGVFEKWYAKNGSAVRRKAIYEGMPIPEINDFFKTHAPEVFKEGIFETNPLKIALARSRRMAKSLSTAEFVGGTIGQYGRVMSPSLKKAGWKTTEEILAEIPRARLTLSRGLKGANGEEILTRLGRQTKGMAVPAEVAEALVETIKTMTNPKTPNAFIGLYDQLTRTFKLGATALFPEFHVRNGVSNFWANYLADVRNFKSYSDAFRAMRGDAKAMVDLGAVSMTAEELFTRLKEHGLTGRTHSMLNPGEVSQVNKPVRFREPGEGLGAAAARAPGRTVKKAARLGLKTGTAVEDWAKVAHVIEKMRKGMGLEEAVYSAKKFLFDYSDLTSFEKTVMRRIVPFYTWTRKNLPLQLESLFTEPGKIAQAGLVMRAMQNGSDGEPSVDTTMVPQWMRRRFWGASKHDDDSITLFSGLGIGLEDLAIFDRPVAEFMAMLNPLVKAPLQAATNRDFFRDTDLDRAEIAPPVLKYFKMAPGGQAFLDSIGFREVKNDDGEPKYSRANPRFLNFLRGFFEVGGVSRAINTIGSIGADRPTSPTQPLKFLTALRVQHSDTRQQMKQHMITLLEAYRDRLEELRRQGVTEEFKSFFVERDLVDDTPEVKEAKALIRELGKVGKALRTINSAGPPVINEMAVDVRRDSLRSGGR